MEILVVDDDSVYREAVLLFLEGTAVCHCVEEGAEGLSVFERRVVVGRPFAAVVVDNEMPGLKGVEVIRGIRNLEARWGMAQTPIVIVSSASLEGEEAEVLNDERVRYLAKPFSHSSLLDIVGHLSVLVGGSAAAIDPVPGAVQAMPPRILSSRFRR